MKFWRVCATLTLAILAACGGGGELRGDSALLPGRSGSSAGAPGGGESGKAPGGSPSAAPTRPIVVRPTPTGVETPEVPNFVKADVIEGEGWGPGCFVPKPGLACTVPFEGVGYLSSAKSGKIALSAFENEAQTPAAIRLLPAVKGSNKLCVDPGCPHGGAWLPYSPSIGARIVTFFVEIQGPDGAVLARTPGKTFPIPS